MAVFVNDHFMEDEEAVLNMTDLSIQRGYAVFDFFRTVNGQPLFLADHLDRFFYSAAAMRLPVRKSHSEIKDIIFTLIKKSGYAQAGIRLLLTGGYSTDTFHPAEPNFLVSCKPLDVLSARYFEKGFQIMTYHYQRELPYIKSTNYMMGVWLQPVLKEKQADDVLYYQDSLVTEFPRSNLFIVTKEKTLVTPAVNVLAGVTRKKVIALGKSFLKTEERNITIDELKNAEEIFLTGTSKRIIPVIAVDNQYIGKGRTGLITRQLYEQFMAMEKQITG